MLSKYNPVISDCMSLRVPIYPLLQSPLTLEKQPNQRHWSLMTNSKNTIQSLFTAK